MWTIAEVKSRGKTVFMANYWYCVLAVFLLGAVGAISGATMVFAILIKVLLVNPFALGCCAFFMENAKSGNADFSTIGEGFRNYWHNVGVLLLKDVYLALWFLLFTIPGWIKYYSYRMVPYILIEHPELSANEVITRSREMMDGNKGQAFLLDLSFIGWYLLGTITAGLGLIFWAIPYSSSTDAALYLKLRREQRELRWAPDVPETAPLQYTAAAYTPHNAQIQPGQQYAVRAVSGPLCGRVFPLSMCGLDFGRQPDNSVCLPADAGGVSGHHCKMALQGTSVMLADLGSTYGTYVSPGTRLEPNRWYSIPVGTKISLGSPHVQFELIRY